MTSASTWTSPSFTQVFCPRTLKSQTRRSLPKSAVYAFEPHVGTGAGGSGTLGLDFDSIEPWTKNDVIDLREMTFELFCALPDYVFKENFFGARDTAHQEHECTPMFCGSNTGEAGEPGRSATHVVRCPRRRGGEAQGARRRGVRAHGRAQANDADKGARHRLEVDTELQHPERRRDPTATQTPD